MCVPFPTRFWNCVPARLSLSSIPIPGRPVTRLDKLPDSLFSSFYRHPTPQVSPTFLLGSQCRFSSSCPVSPGGNAQWISLRTPCNPSPCPTVWAHYCLRHRIYRSSGPNQRYGTLEDRGAESRPFSFDPFWSVDAHFQTPIVQSVNEGSSLMHTSFESIVFSNHCQSLSPVSHNSHVSSKPPLFINDI